jgi:hypothetical protein
MYGLMALLMILAAIFALKNLILDIMDYLHRRNGHHKHKKKHHKKHINLEIELYLNNNITIKGLNMDIKLLKSQFVAQPDGSAIVTGKLLPTDDSGVAKPVADGSVVYTSSNEAALSITKDATDQTKFSVKLVSIVPSAVTLLAEAKTPNGVDLGDSLSITVIDDTPPPPPTEATKLNMQLDVTGQP